MQNKQSTEVEGIYLELPNQFATNQVFIWFNITFPS